MSSGASKFIRTPFAIFILGQEKSCPLFLEGFCRHNHTFSKHYH